MALPLGTDAEVLGSGASGGTKVVGSSTELLHLYGGTPVDQPASVADVTTTAATSTTNAYGYTTAAQADAIVTAINEILARIRETGVISTT